MSKCSNCVMANNGYDGFKIIVAWFYIRFKFNFFVLLGIIIVVEVS